MDESLRHRLLPLTDANRFSAALLERFAGFIAGAPDEQLFRVNPLRFATAMEISEHDAVDLFVHAARAGLFDFAWGLICGSCGAHLSAPGGLRHLSGERKCGVCRVRAGEFLDDRIEVSFTVNPAVRAIRFHGDWDEASPSLVDDALRVYFSHATSLDTPMASWFRRGLQSAFVLQRGQERIVRFDVAPGMWRVIAPTLHAVAGLTVVPGGPNSANIVIENDAMYPRDIEVGAGPLALRIVQRTSAAKMPVGIVTFTGERAHGPLSTDAPSFLSGKRLLSAQSFRELFRTETLPPDGGLEIRALAILFTDLKSSTEMYERSGDLNALARVRAHFDILRDVIDEHSGAVVKTIGDAVMATFTDPTAAAAAGLAMHERITRVPGLELKVGVHVGPCVAVDSNDRLDYFGQTVNIAARVQGLAEGRELVLTDDIRRFPGVDAVLGKNASTAVREEARLKGIAKPMVVHRVSVGS